MRSAYSGKFTDLNKQLNRLTPGKMPHGLLRAKVSFGPCTMQSRAGCGMQSRQLVEVALKGLQGPLEEQLKVIIHL